MSSDLDIMLIGKTGVGKSKTGSSILDRNAFSSVPTMDSATMRSQREVTVLEDGRKLCVVDTPGVGDTRLSVEKGQELFMTAVREAVLFNPAGYHALIIVLRFGSRFTEEDTNTIKYLKTAFGEDFIQKHCIVLMTHGDDFASATAEGEINVSFLEWCKQQTGPFVSLLKEVQGRILLFNNRGTQQEKLQQRQDLVMLVDRLILGGSRYTDANFEEARKHQERLVNDHKISKIAMKVQDELSLILFEKDKIKAKNDDIGVQIFALNALLKRVEDLHRAVSTDRGRSSDLMQLEPVLSRTNVQIKNELVTLQMAKNLKEKEKTGDETSVTQMKSELAKLQKESDVSNTKLNQEYKEARDANNESWASKIWGVVKNIASAVATAVVTNVIIPKVVSYLLKL